MRNPKPVDLEIGQACSLDGHWDMGEAQASVGRLTYNVADGIYEVEATLNRNPSGEFLRDLGGASHGRLVTGEDVTLLNPFDLGGTSRSPGAATARRGAGTVVIGHSVPDRSQQAFDSARFYLPDLEMWLGVRPFEGDASEDGLRFRKPELVEVTIETPSGTLASGWNYHESDEGTRRVLEFRSYLKFSAPAQLSVDDILSFAFRLRQVLSLFMGNEVNVCRLLGVVDRERANILYGDARVPRRRARSGGEMLFTRSEMAGDFASLMAKTFSIYQRYKSTFDLLDVVRSPGQVVELRYLTSVIALEAFDRCRAEQTFVPVEAFEPIKNALVAAIPASCTADLRQALKQRLHFGNERSLGFRLRHLLKSLPAAVQQQITRGQSANDFLEEVKNARNYLVHWPVDRPAHKAMDLWALAARLRAWLHLCLLVEVGIPAERVMEQMLKHPTWHHMLKASSGGR